MEDCLFQKGKIKYRMINVGNNVSSLRVAVDNTVIK